MTNENIITGVNDSNFEISGFLVFNKNDKIIEKCDTNLSSCGELKSGVNTVGYFATNPNNGNKYICVDEKLYVFDGAILENINVECDLDWSAVADNDAVYTVNEDGDVLKLTHEGNQWETVYDRTNIETIAHITQNYLLAKEKKDLQLPLQLSKISKMVAIPKNVGEPINLTSEEEVVLPSIVVENKVYFTKFTFSTSEASIKSCAWEEGSPNTNDCLDNSYYAGYSIKPNGELNTFGEEYPVYRLLRVETVNPTQNGPSGGTLKAINPSDGSTIELGTVPENTYILGVGIGDYLLLTGFNTQTQMDVFYINLSQENSLQNITNTLNKDEDVIF